MKNKNKIPKDFSLSRVPKLTSTCSQANASKGNLTIERFLGIIFSLTHIPKVTSPVRVFLIRPPSVPSCEGSFGPTPRSSSEGFLGTFTPWRRRIRYLPLYCFSEDPTYSDLHFFNGRPVYPRSTPKRGKKIKNLPTQPRVRQEWQYCRSRSEVSDVVGSRGEVLRIEAMNPVSLGILGPLNPTDEALEEGRNTIAVWTKRESFGHSDLNLFTTGFSEKQK